MPIIPTVEEKRRWEYIRDLLRDLMKNPQKLDAMTDVIYRLIWDDKAY